MELQLHTGDIGNYLKKHDIKPSYQRMKIFQYLLDNHNHPTGAQIKHGAQAAADEALDFLGAAALPAARGFAIASVDRKSVV